MPTPPRVYPNHPEKLHFLPLPDGQKLAYRLQGGADGEPWLLLHGGPGSGTYPAMGRVFGAHQYLVLPDQRGAGHSKQRGSARGNTLAALVRDLERLRQHLGIERWGVLGGSWGAALALAYASQHPQAVRELVLRGSFNGSPAEVRRLFARFWPERHPGWRHPRQALSRELAQVFRFATLGVAQRRVVRQWAWMEQRAAARGMWRAWLHTQAQDSAMARQQRQQWAQSQRQQRRRSAWQQQPRPVPQDRALWQKLRVQAHYLAHRCFLAPSQLGRGVRALAAQQTPVTWVHGRFDAVCRPDSARHWHRMWSAGKGLSAWHWTLAGHLGVEPDTERCLRQTLQARAAP